MLKAALKEQQTLLLFPMLTVGAKHTPNNIDASVCVPVCSCELYIQYNKKNVHIFLF